HPARVLPETVFRANAGIVQASRHGMNIGCLTVGILQYVAECPVQHTGLAMTQCCGVLAWLRAAAASLHSDQVDTCFARKGVEDAGRVAAATDTRDHHVGQPANLLQRLLFRLSANHRLEVADNHWEGMWPDHATDDVMRVADSRHPVAQRLVDGVAQSSTA